LKTVNLSLLNDKAFLSGELTRQTISFIPDNSIKALLKNKKTALSLKDVSKIDTAGLAWLFELLEKNQRQQSLLLFTDLPSQLNKLITLSGVEGLLPLMNADPCD
jgi:phospholipid transport system transporter-binding protein